MPEREPPEFPTPEQDRGEKERRRSPRFNCGGFVELNWLPSNGIYVPGRVRDLSLTGCCIDTKAAVDGGLKAEIVVRVKSNSFRAVGEVREVRGGSGAGIEFVRLSAGGKALLEDVVGELARLQEAIDKLKAANSDDPDFFRSELSFRKLQAEMLSTRFPYFETLALEEISERNRTAPKDERVIVSKKPLVVGVDLFG